MIEKFWFASMKSFTKPALGCFIQKRQAVQKRDPVFRKGIEIVRERLR
jgi:hypothetical protein